MITLEKKIQFHTMYIHNQNFKTAAVLKPLYLHIVVVLGMLHYCKGNSDLLQGKI